MRVALVAFDLIEYTERLANALAPFVEVTLFLPAESESPAGRTMDPAVHLERFDKPRLRQPVRQMRANYALVRKIAQARPDVVHLQQGHLWFNLALPFLARYPLVVTAHDPRHHVGDAESSKTPQAILDFGFRRADQVIVHSRELKRVAVHELDLVPDRVHVIPHIVLGDHAVAAAAAAGAPDAPVAAEDHTVLFFGRIWEYKGLEYLIRAEPLIRARVPAARIVIAGQGEDFARYRALMEQPERFSVYNAFISEDRRAQLFEQASVVVLPYVDASQSGVIPLAYAHGKPVVATTVGGLPEAVEDGKTGYLVPPRDERALANAVVRLLADPARRREMGACARHKAETELSPAAVAEQTVRVYREGRRQKDEDEG